MVVSKRLIICAFAVLTFSTTYPLVRGSETSLSVESAVEFPSADLDNTMRGFGWFKNGFTLEDSQTTCTFDSVFPVSGDINLNGGTLFLLQDLELRDVAIYGLGTIQGNHHVITTSQNLAQIASGDAVLHNVSLCSDSNLDLATTVTIRGHTSLCGNGKTLRFAPGAEILIDSDSALELRDIELQGLQNSNFACLDDSSHVILDNVRFMLDDSFSWKNGSILIRDGVSILGTSTFSYSSCQTSTIDHHGQLFVGDGMYFCLGRHADTFNDPLYFEDATSELLLDNCSFISSHSGICLTRGSIVLDREVTLDAMGTSTTTGIILGDGTPANDITLRVKPGAALLHNTGYWVYNNFQPDCIRSSSKTSRMIRSLGSLIYIPQNITLEDITIELLSDNVTPLMVEAGKIVSYENAAVKLPSIEFDITSDQLNAFTYALDGNCLLFITKGILPMYLLVSGTGNELRGNGGFTGAVALSDSSAALTCGINGFIGNSLVLNDGTLKLDYDLLFHGGGAFAGPGTIDLQNNHLTVDSGFHANTPIYWQADQGVVNLYGTVTLTSTWTINGSLTFKGDTTKLVIEEGGEIVVEGDSRVTFKNMKVFGLARDNIRCTSDAGTISYINSKIGQSNNVNFGTGSMSFFLNNTLSGEYTFSYDSHMTSTIQTGGRLNVRDGAALSLGRNGGYEPLYFENKTATLNFDNAKLFVKDSGMHFTRGRLIASRDIEVDVNSTNTANGLIFGDGVSENDVEIILDPASQARFTGGHVTYDITTQNGIISKSQSSRLVRSADSVFYLKHDLDLADLTIDVSPHAQLLVENGSTLSYSKALIVNEQNEFTVSGMWHNPYTMLLNGDGIINLNNGTLPLYLEVANGNNRLDGVGNVGGYITLADSHTNLICNFNGYVFNSIALNGGGLTLLNDLKLANGVQLTGSGSVDLGVHNIFFGESDFTIEDGMLWNGANASINLNSNTSLNATWTFSGDCMLKGHGNTVRFEDEGSIVVDSGSSLILKDVVLDQAAQDKIRCIDDSGSITFDGVLVALNGTFNVSYGSLQFKNKNTISSAYESLLVYETPNISTVFADSSLKLDAGVTFSFAPPNVEGNNKLIQFEDSSSQLILNGATFVTTSSGIELTKGCMDVKRSSHLCTIPDAFTGLEPGISFGNGSDDFTVIVRPGVELTLEGGLLAYRNTNADSLNLASTDSSITIGSGATLKVFENLRTGIGKTVFHNGGILLYTDSSNVIGTIEPLGALRRSRFIP